MVKLAPLVKLIVRSFGVLAILLLTLLMPIGWAYLQAQASPADASTQLAKSDHHSQITHKNLVSQASILTQTNGAVSINEKKLIPNDGASDDDFGQSVSHDGNYAIVGSPYDDNSNGNDAGAAYIYHWDGSSWQQQQKLLASSGAAGDEFAYSVSLHGDIAVVGAYRNDDHGSDSGLAYVYRRNGNNWQEEAILAPAPDDSAANDQFAYSVSVNGDLIVVGARNGDGNAIDSGSAYVYRSTGTTWQLEAELTATDGAADDQFGYSVSAYGDTLILGAPAHDNHAGAAYLYRKQDSTWHQEAKLSTADVPSSNALFGRAVSISHGIAVVGSQFDETHTAPVYVYRFNGSTWESEAQLSPMSGVSSGFATSLAVASNDFIIVGDPDYHNPYGGDQQGAAYLFQYDGSDWRQKKVFLAHDATGLPNYDFAHSVSLDENMVFVGAPSYEASGAAYIYDFLDEFGTPDIDLSSPLVSIFLDEGTQTTESVRVSNIGDGDLHWSMSWSADWISHTITKTTDLHTLLPGHSAQISLTLPNTYLTEGVYQDTLIFTSNDPNQPSIEVLVEVVVGTTQIDGITPNRAVANAGHIPVIINGRFREPLTATLGGAELLSVTLQTHSTLHAVVPVSGTLSAGVHNLTVHSNGERLSLSNAFTVTEVVTETQFLAMVYLACDNNLTNSCRRLFNNLELAMISNPNLRIAAFWDGEQYGDSGYYLIEPDDNPYAWASYDDTNSVSLGELDSSDPATLVQFTSWAQSQYPGEYSFLSLVDHGGGWAPDFYPSQRKGHDWAGPGENVGGMFWDDQAGGVMTTRALADALGWISNGDQLDLIYLDACFMATVEVIAELKPYAEYFVAYENFSWATYRYDLYFDDVDSSTTPLALAQRIAQINHDNLPTEGHPAQIGVINANAMNNLLVQLDTLALELSATLTTTTRLAIQEAVQNSAHVDENGDWFINEEDSAIDLLHFAKQLNLNPAMPASVKTAAQNLIEGFETTINSDNNYIHNGTPWPGTEEWDLSNLGGLSVYFPLADEWKRSYYSDEALPHFASQTHWDEFIQLWYQGQTAPSPPTEPCEDCLITPMNIGLSTEPPILSDGELIWVPIKLQGVSKADDAHSIQLNLHISDTTVLIPAVDQSPRMGDLFPSNSFTYSVPTGDQWHFILSDHSADTISGTGLIVELPFYFKSVGCTELEFTTLLYDSVPSKINHYAVADPICNSGVGNVSGAVKLERRTPNTHADSTIKLNGEEQYEHNSQANGEYLINSVIKDSYTVRFEHPRFLYYETTLTVDGLESMPQVTLCAGDINQDDVITTSDQELMIAGIVPVSFSDYDLNADGGADIGDLFILRENLSKTAPAQCPSHDAHSLTGHTIQVVDATKNRAYIMTPLPAGEVTATLRAENINHDEQFGAIGIRLDLPANTTVDLENDIELLGSYADGFLDAGLEDDDLILVLMPPSGQALSEDTQIAHIRMNVPHSGEVSVQATNPASLHDRLTFDIQVERQPEPLTYSLYLPMIFD
ncbi:MAG: clostripain-related cysteine peptidase [Ardenticatenaceae bacterium]